MDLLRQIYCAEGTTCRDIPLLKRKVLKKGLFGVSWITVISVLLYTFGFLWFLFPILVQLPTLPSEGIATYPPDPFSAYRVKTLIFLLILFFILFNILSLFWQALYFRFYFYDLRKDNVIIKKGVISRTEIVIDYGKIQNVFVDQDFWDRIFGLYDVHIATADPQSDLAAHIDGVDAVNAEKLRDELVRRWKAASSQTSTGL